MTLFADRVTYSSVFYKFLEISVSILVLSFTTQCSHMITMLPSKENLREGVLGPSLCTSEGNYNKQ